MHFAAKVLKQYANENYAKMDRTRCPHLTSNFNVIQRRCQHIINVTTLVMNDLSMKRKNPNIRCLVQPCDDNTTMDIWREHLLSGETEMWIISNLVSMKMSRRRERIPPEMIVTPDMALESENPDPPAQTSVPPPPSPKRKKIHGIFLLSIFIFVAVRLADYNWSR
jgi:hypothetical protein